MIIAEGTSGFGQSLMRSPLMLRTSIWTKPRLTDKKLPIKATAAAPTAEGAATAAATTVAAAEKAVDDAGRRKVLVAGGVALGLAVAAFVFRKQLRRLFRRGGA